MATQLDLYKSAFNAASSTLDAANGHELNTKLLNTFNNEGFDPKDYEFWESSVDRLRQYMLALKQNQAAIDARNAAQAAQKH